MAANVPEAVAVNRVRLRIPIVFCASLVPWLNPMSPALSSCAFPKIWPTRCGLHDRRARRSSDMTMKPMSSPRAGDDNIGMITFG